MAAHVLAHNYSEKKRAYELFSDTLKLHNHYRLWIKYAQFAISLQDFTQARMVFGLSIRGPLLYSHHVHQAWIEFEETYGTLESHSVALSAISTARERDARNPEFQALSLAAKDTSENDESKKKRSREEDVAEQVDPKKIKSNCKWLN